MEEKPGSECAFLLAGACPAIGIGIRTQVGAWILRCRRDIRRMNATFHALLKEASFTKDMLGAGATQLRKANYASKGVYFQSFVSLSTGLERIGKLCLMLDYYIEHSGSFPSFDYLKKNIGHSIDVLYRESRKIVEARAFTFRFGGSLDGPIHQSIVGILSAFASGDRYSNINLLVGSRQVGDPVARWYREVDLPLYETRVTAQRKITIEANADLVAEHMSSWGVVYHGAEDGLELTDFREASLRTGIYEAVCGYRQLYALQVIRYWVELIGQLERIARAQGRQNIPFFGELFAMFYNDDSYFRSRKTWQL